MPFKLAIDGMGGDRAPDIVVHGMHLAKSRVPQLEFLLFGDEKRLLPLVKNYKNIQHVEIVHTDEVVPQDMRPSIALRTLKKSSMRLAVEAVSKGQADGVVSAGNTGVYLMFSKLILKTLKGISRPTIVSEVPHEKGEAIVLDLGANIEVSPRILVEFAVMGEIFARHVLFKSSPKVGLLNIGSEAVKGPETLKKAFDALQKLPLNFHGFIEGDDITKGTVDVVVTDGFSGNVVLKAGEGIMRLVFDALKRTLQSSWRGKLAYLIGKPMFHTLAKQFDPRRYNGAFWLGLDGVAVKSHGGTDAYGFSYAIDVAVDILKAELNKKVSQEIEKESVQNLLESIE
jgi:glycerol-3-phosphate acyltransferase PlsX